MRRGTALVAIAAGAVACAPAAPRVNVGADHVVAVAEPSSDARGVRGRLAAEPEPQPLLDGPFVDLAVERHGSAIVSVPIGATTPRPVLVVAHGAGDRPEWQCEVWREIVGERGFVLCLRGFPINRFLPPEQAGYFFPDHHALGREITLALEALRARFGERVDLEAPAYAGFSQGAIMGALLLPEHPAKFSRAALVEGGYGLFQEWNIPVATKLQQRGGQRVLLACGRVRCAEQARVTASYMTKAGLEARVVHAEGAGHTYWGAMADEVARAADWVFEGDARWMDGRSR